MKENMPTTTQMIMPAKTEGSEELRLHAKSGGAADV
jgi:hypothetical protein